MTQFSHHPSSPANNATGHADSAVAQPAYEAAIEYARRRLASLPEFLTYHSFDHTFDEVMPAALRLAQQHNLSDHDTHLLAVAVAFHDIGWTVQSFDHEQASMAIADAVLPEFGFSVQDIGAIKDMIRATELPQTPNTLLEQIIADADLDCLGCPDFWQRSKALRTEQAHFGHTWTDDEWYQMQIEFLEGHSYFTEETRRLREPSKRDFVHQMKEILNSHNNHSI